jgi:hypothetical protein
MSTQRSPASSAQPGGGDEQPGGVEAIVADVVDERAELLGCPDLAFGCQALRRVDRVGDIAR